jgi:hypothetical protein
LIKPIKKLKYHYSGDASHDFWDLINKIDGPKHDTFYTLGVALQELEEYVLGRIQLKRPKSIKNRR